MSALPTLDAIRSDFAFLDDWEDRYRYVIELGRMLEPLSEAERTDANKVRGCASQVWLASRVTRDAAGHLVFTFVGDSDAHIVRGLVALLVALYSGRRVEDIAAIDAHGLFDELGLSAHLTPQRSNGLASMVTRIRADARAAMERSAEV